MESTSNKTDNIRGKLIFSYLPAYAKFIRENYLVDFIKEQINSSRDLKVPLHKNIARDSDNSLIERLAEEQTQLLLAAEKNTLKRYVQESMDFLMNSQLEIIKHDGITIEDKTHLNFLRKRALMSFLPKYTSDPFVIVEIAKEIDCFHLENDQLTNATFNSLLQQIKQKKELYKQAQAISHIGNWTWDIATNHVTWTEELYRIFGFSNFSEEVNYEKYLSHIHPEDKKMVLDQLQNAFETHNPFDFLHRIILNDGTEKIIHSKGEVLVDSNGNPYQMLGTGQDVTNQKLIEQELRANKEFIHKITDTTPTVITLYNIQTGKFSFINNAIETVLGYRAAQMVETGIKSLLNLMHQDDFFPLFKIMQTTLKNIEERTSTENTEVIVDHKHRIQHKNGNYRWLHTFGTIFDRNKKGEIIHLLNVSVDITEQEEARLALTERNHQLQQSNASLEEYAYIASHDLKEPLRKIATFSSRLAATQSEKLDNDGKLYLSKIISCTERMQNMINDLLSISVITSNKTFQQYSLNEILGEVLQTLEFKIEEKNAVIVTDTLPSANIVVSQFRQLFQNLMSNSLKFARREVQPKIKFTHQYLSPSEVINSHLKKATRYLKITIEDNGIGFENEFSSKIFDIFERLHGTTSYEGTGIGLAICKKIAEHHGGTIMAHGISNQGATFTIIIPA